MQNMKKKIVTGLIILSIALNALFAWEVLKGVVYTLGYNQAKAEFSNLVNVDPLLQKARDEGNFEIRTGTEIFEFKLVSNDNPEPIPNSDPIED